MAKRSLTFRTLIEFRAGTTKVVTERDASGKLTKAVIQRAKLLGPVSANKNSDGTQNVYTLEARREALPKYEGVRINVDHRKPGEARAPRSIRDGIGVARGVTAEVEGTFGDLHLSPSHPLTEHVVWSAENAPSSLGLSHAANGMGLVEGKNCLIQKITAVESVDLVSDPATTRGLFESRDPTTPTMEATSMDPKALLAILDGELDDAAKIQAIREAVAAGQEEPEEDPAEGEEAPAEDGADEDKDAEQKSEETTESRRASGDRKLLESMRRELDELKVERRGRERRDLVENLLRESALPEDAVTDTFRDTLVAAKNEAAIKALIEDRRGVYGGNRPASRDPGPGRKPAGPAKPAHQTIDVSKYGLKSRKGS